jgi:predicted amidophosphoribosyltransferase
VVRTIALRLKFGLTFAVEVAAREMASLIDGPCWLVPVPSSSGSLATNFALAKVISTLVYGARVKCAVRRLRPVESSYARRIKGLPGLTIQEHSIIRITSPIEPLPAYFVDNVATTGTTVKACRRALGWGVGLVYADASTYRTTASS